MNMTFQDYDCLNDVLNEVPDGLRSYGLTKYDKERIECEPDRYVPYVMYLAEHLKKDTIFSNRSADKAEDTLRWANAFLRKYLVLYDDDDDSE